MISAGPTRTRITHVKNKVAMPGKKMALTLIQPGTTPIAIRPDGTEHSSPTYNYTHPESMMDSPDAWASEHHYYGLGADTTPTESPWYSTLLTGAMSLYQQKVLADANAKRAQSGLAPYNAQQYAEQQIPAARVQAGLDTNTRNLLMYGGIAAAAIALLFVLKRK